MNFVLFCTFKSSTCSPKKHRNGLICKLVMTQGDHGSILTYFLRAFVIVVYLFVAVLRGGGSHMCSWTRRCHKHFAFYDILVISTIFMAGQGAQG